MKNAALINPTWQTIVARMWIYAVSCQLFANNQNMCVMSQHTHCNASNGLYN